MPAKSPTLTSATTSTLTALGEQLRAQRKAQHISATTAAEAAGISRVTLHRIEHGEPSVTMGAYLTAAHAIGLQLGLLTPESGTHQTPPSDRSGWIPARIRLADYPQLKQLAWQVHGLDELSPNEALSIYERNARHLDAAQLQANEKQLIDALRSALGTPGDRSRHV